MAPVRVGGQGLLLAFTTAALRTSTAVAISGALAKSRCSKHSTKCAGCLGVLQWNMHGECFNHCHGRWDKHCDPAYPACRGNATALLVELLQGSMGELDFAGTEQLNDEEFLKSGLPRDGDWAHIEHTCGGEQGFGVYPFDIATIFYRRSRWIPLEGPHGPGQPLGGCMERVHDATEPNYRAFVVQAFEHRQDGSRVVVAASHNPHFRGYHKEIGALAESVRLVQEHTDARRFILIADTNWEHPEMLVLGRTSQNVMEDIFPNAGQVASTKLHLTCCAWTYVHTYDRIIMAGFPGASEHLNTTLPFAGVVPAWVALNMHSPIIGRLIYSTGAE